MLSCSTLRAEKQRRVYIALAANRIYFVRYQLLVEESWNFATYWYRRLRYNTVVRVICTLRLGFAVLGVYWVCDDLLSGGGELHERSLESVHYWLVRINAMRRVDGVGVWWSSNNLAVSVITQTEPPEPIYILSA